VVLSTDVAASLQSRLDAALRSEHLGGAAISVHVAEAASGKALASIDGNTLRVPASNMKLITTAAALKVLGTDFTFETRLVHVSADDEAKPGVATLLVDPDGDPGFCDPRLLKASGRDVDDVLTSWVKAVKDAGIKRVDRLLVHDRTFDDRHVHPDWPEDQLQYWYCAPVASLNFYDNCVEVHPQPRGAGQTPRITIVPNVRFLTMHNTATSGDVNTFRVSRRMGGNDLVLAGVVKHRLARPAEVTVHDPPMFFLRVLQERLEDAGVEVGGIARTAEDEAKPKGRTIAVEKTSIADNVTRCNKYSQNLFAEALMKRMGRAVTGSRGSWDSGAAAMRIYLKEVLGSESSIVRIVDGSGLSDGNRVTARLFSDLLCEVKDDKDIGELFVNSLSVGGVDGALRNRLKEHKHLRGRVFAKSGYIRGVITLSGYLVVTPEGKAIDDKRSPSERLGAGRVLVFSVLINGFEPPKLPSDMRQMQDYLLHVIDAAVRPEVVAAQKQSSISMGQ